MFSHQFTVNSCSLPSFSEDYFNFGGKLNNFKAEAERYSGCNR